MNAPMLPAGTWQGTNAFRLMPSDEPATAPLTLVVSAPGALLQIAYVWQHPVYGAAQGSLAVGPAEQDGDALLAVWRDTWHQPQAQVLRGAATASGLTLEYFYEADWTWRLILEQPEAGALDLRMVNVVPASVTGAEGLAYDAMSARLTP